MLILLETHSSFEADNLNGIHISVSLIGKVLFVDAKVKN